MTALVCIGLTREVELPSVVSYDKGGCVSQCLVSALCSLAVARHHTVRIGALFIFLYGLVS